MAAQRPEVRRRASRCGKRTHDQPRSRFDKLPPAPVHFSIVFRHAGSQTETARGAMRIPVSQIPEDGWSRTLDIPLSSLGRVVEQYGPQSGTLHAEVRLKNRRGNIDVSGSLAAPVRVGCRLCGEEGPLEVAAPLELMVVPTSIWLAGAGKKGHAEVQLSAQALDVSFYDGEEIDLRQLLEDELLLATPDSLGEEDEDGRCTHCHRHVAELFPADSEADTFHPFRELAERVKKGAGKPRAKD